MSEALRRVRIGLLVLALVEIAAILTGVLLFFFDYPVGIQQKMETKYWIFALCGIFAIDMIVLWVTIGRVSSLRHKTDLDAASIIGSDVQEAYSFGQIGLVVTDESDIVLWDNNLFKDRQISLLDQNIFEWQPELEKLKTTPLDNIVKIEVNGHNYDVKYLPDARLFIFKDTTDYEGQVSYSRSIAPVIGVIMIDNFADIVGKTEDENNDLVTQVRTSIMNYFRGDDILLRRYRNDSYLAIGNYVALEAMLKDGFSILDTIRAHGKGQNITPTLSIGFAHGTDNVLELNEMASSAVGMAQSRGGDQAVVSKYGEDIRFYGGKTAAVESASAVKFRSGADGLIRLIRDSSDVLVSGHTDMDMDALAGCIGILAICERLKKPCRIIIDLKRVEKKTKIAYLSTFPDKAVREKVSIDPRQAESKLASSDSTLLVIVDVSVPMNIMAGEGCLLRANKVALIDHHRRGESFIENPLAFEYIEPSASSVSEIIAEFIHYAAMNPRIEVQPIYATAMLAGICLDTNFFKSNSVGVRTFEAAEVLREFGADPRRADDYFKDEYEEYLLINKIGATMRTPYRGVVYAVAEEGEILERATLAKVANALMQVRDVNACFVIGRIQDKSWSISARSDQTINVGLIMDKLGGGGHYSAAACVVNDASVKILENRLLGVLESYLDEARNSMGGK